MCATMDTDNDTLSFTVSLDTDCELFEYLTFVVVIGVFCLLGIVGNIISAVVLHKHKTETSTTILLKGLAISDTLLLATSLLLYTAPRMLAARFPSSLRRLSEVDKYYVWPVATMAHTATIWLTVCVTATRYCAVTYPAQQLFLASHRGARLEVLITSVFALLYSMPRFWEHRQIGTHLTGNTSTPVYLGDNKVYQVVYSNLLYFPIMYIAPLLLLAIFNYRLIQALRDLTKKRLSMTIARPMTPRPDDQITLCVVLIVCTFIVCQTPALLNQIFWTALADRDCGDFHYYYTRISDVLIVVNSTTNFAIYCLFGKSFRKIFLDTFWVRGTCSGPQQSAVSPQNGGIPMVTIEAGSRSPLAPGSYVEHSTASDKLLTAEVTRAEGSIGEERKNRDSNRESLGEANRVTRPELSVGQANRVTMTVIIEEVPDKQNAAIKV